MKEVPVTLVRANQTMLVCLTALAILFQAVWIAGLALAAVISSLVFGPKGNIAFRVARAVTKKDLSRDDTEAAVLQRFNQTIAASLLAAGVLVLLITGHWSGWLFIGMVTIAASVALMGFCVGCFLYYQFKKITYEARNR
ncbi:DUF4395 domain-containing protein [Evansella clarkii]|uniref:DUF4395 domain-containing protein n=1 Tax=Evansella clarkii TaxID=79879 RepID=UPI0009988A28|nr:DUF4395 domain-containing protein [Evansella clarkii]